jgi:hypothetical protein
MWGGLAQSRQVWHVPLTCKHVPFRMRACAFRMHVRHMASSRALWGLRHAECVNGCGFFCYSVLSGCTQRALDCWDMRG